MFVLEFVVICCNRGWWITKTTVLLRNCNTSLFYNRRDLERLKKEKVRLKRNAEKITKEKVRHFILWLGEEPCEIFFH